LNFIRPPKKEPDKLAKANEIIELYRLGAIKNIRTAKNIIMKLSSGRKSLNEKATKETGTIKNKMEERRQEELRSKAKEILKKKFKHKLIFKITKRTSAFKNYLCDIEVRPTFIGSEKLTDIKDFLAKAYLTAIKELPINKTYKFHSDVVLSVQGTAGPDMFHVKSKLFTKQPFKSGETKNQYAWLLTTSKNVEDAIQSGEQVFLEESKVIFHFAELPSGSGKLKESKTLLEHYSKKCVIQVKNKDNNCFLVCPHKFNM
jgi:hypothetical protein